MYGRLAILVLLAMLLAACGGQTTPASPATAVTETTIVSTETSAPTQVATLPPTPTEKTIATLQCPDSNSPVEYSISPAANGSCSGGYNPIGVTYTLPQGGSVTFELFKNGDRLQWNLPQGWKCVTAKFAASKLRYSVTLAEAFPTGTIPAGTGFSCESAGVTISAVFLRDVKFK